MSDHEYTCAAVVQQMNQSRMIQNDFLKQKGIELLMNSKNGDVEAVRKLLAQGAPFLSDALGSSPMHWSVKNKHYAITELLLKGGIPRDVRNKVDRTPLHIAAELGDSASTQLLLEYGADADPKDILKMRPLHWAAQSGDIKTVRLLLDYGADFIATNKFGKTASDISFKKNHLNVFHLIQEFKTIEKSIREQTSEKLKQQVKPAVASFPNLQQSCQDKPTDKQVIQPIEKSVREQKTVKLVKPTVSFSSNGEQHSNPENTKEGPSEPLKRKFSDLEEESRSGDEDLLDKVSESALQQLKFHGINLLESLHDSTLRTAVERGGKLVLTDAGKLALSAFDKLFPGRNLPPPPAEMVEATTIEVDYEAEREAKNEELRVKKENLKRRISFNKSQALALRNKLMVTENRIKTLEDELNSLEK